MADIQGDNEAVADGNESDAEHVPAIDVVSLAVGSAPLHTSQSVQPSAPRGVETKPAASKRNLRAIVARMFSKTAPAAVRLSREQLRDRLCLNSSGLVEEIQSVALRQNQLEEARESRLDSKAGGLLGAAGLSLTVAFTFGGLLLQHPEYLTPLGPWIARATLGAYVVALTVGLLASIWAIKALLVSDAYKTLSDNDVFNAEELQKIDEQAGNDDEKAKRLYRRYLTIQHWSIFRAHFDEHERKATIIKRGQKLFVGFLITLLAIGGVMTYSAFAVYRAKESPAATAPNLDLPTVDQ